MRDMTLHATAVPNKHSLNSEPMCDVFLRRHKYNLVIILMIFDSHIFDNMFFQFMFECVYGGAFTNCVWYCVITVCYCSMN